MPTLTHSQRIAKLEEIVGLRFMDKPVTPEMLVPANQLSNGRYPQPLSDLQLHTAIGDIYTKIKDIYEKIGLLAAALGSVNKSLIPPMQQTLTDQAAKIEALEGRPAGGGNVVISPPSARAALEQLGFAFASDGTLSGFKLITKGAPEGDYFGYVGVNDGALRLFAGIREKIGGAWPEVDVNRNLPVIMGPVVERDGAISWDYDPPLLASDPNPNPFKTWLIYLAGFTRGGGPRKVAGPYIDFGTFEKGRGWRFFTRRAVAHADIDVALQFDAENPDAVAIRVGGLLRRVVVDAGGRLAVGEVVDENQ